VLGAVPVEELSYAPVYCRSRSTPSLGAGLFGVQARAPGLCRHAAPARDRRCRCRLRVGQRRARARRLARPRHPRDRLRRRRATGSRIASRPRSPLAPACSRSRRERGPRQTLDQPQEIRDKKEVAAPFGRIVHPSYRTDKAETRRQQAVRRPRDNRPAPASQAPRTRRSSSTIPRGRTPAPRLRAHDAKPKSRHHQQPNAPPAAPAASDAIQMLPPPDPSSPTLVATPQHASPEASKSAPHICTHGCFGGSL
jgi:hypothetical protein